MNISKRGNEKSGKTKTIINLVFRSTAENFQNYMEPANETKHSCYGSMNIKFLGQSLSFHTSHNSKRCYRCKIVSLRLFSKACRLRVIFVFKTLFCI